VTELESEVDGNRRWRALDSGPPPHDFLLLGIWKEQAIASPSELTGEAAARALEPLGYGLGLSSGFASTAASTPRLNQHDAANTTRGSSFEIHKDASTTKGSGFFEIQKDASTTKGSGFEIDQELVDLLDEQEHTNDKAVLSEIETMMAGLDLSRSSGAGSSGANTANRTREAFSKDDEQLMMEILEDTANPHKLLTPFDNSMLLA